MFSFRSIAAAVIALAAGPALGAGDSVVVVNEIHYHPANPALEYVELHNQLSVNVDMSGWLFDGGITYAFPEGTVIPARGYLVVAKDPAALQTATGFAGAHGPFAGQLSNDGESLKVWNNNSALRTRPNPDTPPAATELWSLDIQGDGTGGGQVPPTVMSVAEPTSGFGNVWNALTVPGHPGTVANPSIASLKDSAGNVTGVGFSITGTVSGYSYSPPTPPAALYNDYLFVNAGGASASITWQLTGLNPAKTYSLWVYGGNLRGIRINVDRNANGLGDDTAVTAPTGGGVLISGITPTVAGVINGNANTASGEGNWGGLQLFVPGASGPPFVPGTYNMNLEKRRLMEEMEYQDSGAWPVGPDGSGFTLAKIDPKGGSKAANWTTSAQLNGTPGGLNFAIPGSVSATAALDTSGNNRHATTVSGVSRTTGGGGYQGEAFNFDTGSAVEVPVNITPATVPNATVGAWVQVSAIASPARHQIIASDNGGYDRGITVDSRNGGAEQGTARYAAFGGASTGVVPGMNATTSDGWVFVCSVFDTTLSQTRLHVNANAAVTGGLTHNASQTFLRIGSLPGGSEFFRGKIDNAFVFKRALTVAEINGIRTGGAAAIKAPALAADLLALYEFEDPAAGTALPATGPPVAFNEISGATDPNFRVELYNHSATPVDLTGWQIVNGDTNATYTFPAGSIPAGTYLTIHEASLGFEPQNNARLYLFNAAKARLVDAARVANSARARQTPGTGRWLRPNATTFGAANTFTLSTAIVMNEIFYHAFDEGQPEQWIELKNRSGAAVNLAGWRFTEGIEFEFPIGTMLGAGEHLVVSSNSTALLAKYPGRNIIGNFDGNLANRGERLVLEDAAENPADEVTYEDGGRWPGDADGGGASLELRDPDAENAVPESWAASNTTPLGSWQTITYSGIATDDGLGNDAFKDFLLGLLESGEVLIDDVSVRENPTGANTEFIQNGTFEGDVAGTVPLKWRCLGNHGIHGRTVVIADPDNASNKCLRVVATGTTEDKSNRIETTFAGGRQVTVGNTYQISFRARWMAGTNKVNTRLYFNYLQRTESLNVGTAWGTPGQTNSTALANAGPTVSGLSHAPTVPAASTPVTVSARITDPDGVTSAQVFYRVAAGPWLNVSMSLGADGRHTGTIPGQAAGALVQFYVSASDGALTATFPSAGQKSGAFYRVNDGAADNTGLRGNFRILTAPENETLLFLNTNRMSNDTFPATIIEDERIVHYNVAFRLKGSAFGRYAGSEFGYNIDFLPEQPFRGVHTSVSIERAGNMKEIVAKHLLNRAGGGYWSQYDDVAKVMGPGGISAPALIAAARTTGVFLESLFPGEDSGTIFNHELLYQPSATVDTLPESLKLNNPYNHTRGTYDLADRGADKEAYRWGWQIRNQRKRDDYSSIVRLNRAWALNGAAFKNEIDATIDVDQWMRTWAIMGIYGNDDQFGRQFAHNWRLYTRPTDGRLIALPWDLDRAFQLGVTDSLTPTNHNIPKLFTVVPYKRQFDSHALDLVNTTVNGAYMAPWVAHLGTVTGETAEFAPLLGYISGRGNYALSTLPAAVPFAITTNGGNDFTTGANTTVLAGNGWVDVHTITRTGQSIPLAVTWTGSTTWSVNLPLTAGVNAVTLQAHDQHGTLVGTDSINITSATTNVAASAAHIVISEIHYHPADPTPAEFAAGHEDADDFQFVELHNISAAAVELAGAAFNQGVTFHFTQSTVVPAGGTFVLARNAAAFQMRYGFAPAGVYGGRLSHDDETVTLVSATSDDIRSFRYEDNDPWPKSADGDGYSLILLRPKTGPDHTDAFHWSSSATIGGTPGTVENITFASWLASYPGLPLTGPLDDPDHDGLSNLVEFGLRSNPAIPSAGLTPLASREVLPVEGIDGDYFVFSFRRHIGATDVTFEPVASLDLLLPFDLELAHHGSVNNGDGTETVQFRGELSAGGKKFGRLKVVLED